jgi:hypothetical protein
MSNYGKKGRRLRRIVELQKVKHPGEMPEELKVYVDNYKNYGGRVYDQVKETALYEYWKATGEYSRAQDEISRIKNNLVPKQFATRQASYTAEQYLSDNAEFNGE